MFVTSVIAIQRGVPYDELDYFYKEKLAPGTLVVVPFRTRKVTGVVLSSKPVRAAKASLRSERYALKKITSVHREGSISLPLLLAAQRTANYYHAPLPQLLARVAPAAVLATPVPVLGAQAQAHKAHEVLVLSETEEERYAHHRRSIRELLARKQSVILVTPSYAHAERAERALAKGISHYLHRITLSESPRALKSAWERAQGAHEACLTIVTPGALSVPLPSLGMIIMEYEASPAYRSSGGVALPLGALVEYYAAALGIPLIKGDQVLSVETVARAHAGEAQYLIPPKSRYLARSSVNIIDMRSRDEQGATSRGEIKTIGITLAAALKSAAALKRQSLIVVGRKGLAPTTVCNDCGNVLRCARCANPVVLDRAEKRYLFACYRCGVSTAASDRCPDCGSWRLALLGIGSTRVADELARLLPKNKIFRSEGEERRPGERARTVAEWSETSGALLVATESVLPHLSGDIDTIGIASIDSLLSIPDFRAGERIMRTVLTLRDHAARALIIQSRQPHAAVLKYAAQGNVAEYYRSELAERERFRYPPFVVLVTVTIAGTRARVLEEATALVEQLRAWEPTLHVALSSSVKSFAVRVLLRVAHDSWPDTRLNLVLKELPSEYRVAVDPPSIL